MKWLLRSMHRGHRSLFPFPSSLTSHDQMIALLNGIFPFDFHAARRDSGAPEI